MNRFRRKISNSDWGVGALRGYFQMSLVGVLSHKLPDPPDGVVFCTKPSKQKMTQISPNVVTEI